MVTKYKTTQNKENKSKMTEKKKGKKIESGGQSNPHDTLRAVYDFLSPDHRLIYCATTPCVKRSRQINYL